MHNNTLKTDLKNILTDSYKSVIITKSNVGGSSISVVNNDSSEDVEVYIYYDRVKQRDEDFEETKKILKNE